MSGPRLEHVGELMREVAAQVIVPRFRALTAADIEEKAPGELVTIVDREAEKLLERGLLRILPGTRVVGEEGTAVRPELLRTLHEGAVWLIDPLDGTGNFVAGRACFAVMVALLSAGETVGAWLLDPLSGQLARAERGAGAYVEHTDAHAGSQARMRTDPASPGVSALRGAVLSKYMPTPLRTHVQARVSALAETLPGTHCAGAEYPAIVRGQQDFAVFYRTLPWDHAPGCLFLSESGGVAARYDRTPYRPADRGPGLLVARSQAVWDDAYAALLADRP